MCPGRDQISLNLNRRFKLLNPIDRNWRLAIMLHDPPDTNEVYARTLHYN